MRIRALLPLVAIVLVLGLGATALADTIRLKDGSIIKGKVVGFKDQQFTILIGNAARGRQSRLTIYIDDVDSIEFDGATGVASTNDDDRPQPAYNPPASNPPRPSNTGGSTGSTPCSVQSAPREQQRR